jgi:hypothetical protein
MHLSRQPPRPPHPPAFRRRLAFRASRKDRNSGQKGDKSKLYTVAACALWFNSGVFTPSHSERALSAFLYFCASHVRPPHLRPEGHRELPSNGSAQSYRPAVSPTQVA